MADGIEALSEKVDNLSAVTARLAWVLSDADFGLVGQVKAVAIVVGELKESRDDHEARIKAIQTRHDTQDKNAAELRQPAIAAFFSLVEKLVFVVISLALGWLWAIKK